MTTFNFKQKSFYELFYYFYFLNKNFSLIFYKNLYFYNILIKNNFNLKSSLFFINKKHSFINLKLSYKFNSLNTTFIKHDPKINSIKYLSLDSINNFKLFNLIFLFNYSMFNSNFKINYNFNLFYVQNKLNSLILINPVKFINR